MFYHPTLNKKLILPKALADKKNGFLTSDIMTPIMNSSLVKEAAYAWSAMCHYARHRDEIFLSGNSFYRNYYEQLFLKNYSATPSLAELSATPGLSSHGLGLAIDVGTIDGTYVSPNNTVNIADDNDPTWEWLSRNLEAFGFGFEYNDQPWHIVYQAGDSRPRKVQYFLSSVEWTKTQYEKGRFGSSPFITGRFTLLKGSNSSFSDHIKYLQAVLLFGKRFTSTGVKVTGVFDEATDAAVKLLQTKYGLTSNGIVNSETWYAVNHEAIGMVGKNIWPKNKITIYVNQVKRPVSKLVPNVKPLISEVDWTDIPNETVSSSTFQNTPQEMFHAYQKIGNHPNFWATKEQVWGKRYGYSADYINRVFSGSAPAKVYRLFNDYKSCGWSAYAKIKLRDFINPATGKSYGSSRTFMFPSLLNFLWISMEAGFIWDLYGGSTGAKGQEVLGLPFPPGSHQAGVAIDLQYIGHVNYGGCFAWDSSYESYRDLQIREVPLSIRNPPSTSDTIRGKSNDISAIDSNVIYNRKSQYIQCLKDLKNFCLALPTGLRPWGFATPLYKEECKQVGIYPYMDKDVNPNHIHVDFSNGQRGISSPYPPPFNRYGLLLPDLLP